MVEAIVLDRRQRRRLQTIEEVLDIAVELMTEQGVAGLTVGEIARRMGIRPPSLYVYFPSKNAVYDALFARGARDVLAALQETDDRLPASAELEQTLLEAARTFARWCVEHPAYTQLLFWRPVPGFAPSPEAYQPAVALVAHSRQRFTALQQRGLIRPDADLEAVHRDWTILTAGIVSQQLSNAPDESFEDGRFTAALPTVVAMFVHHYGTPPLQRKGSARARQR